LAGDTLEGGVIGIETHRAYAHTSGSGWLEIALKARKAKQGRRALFAGVLAKLATTY
jgi:hypothetical protein